MNLSEPDFKNLEDVSKDGDAEIEGGLEGLAHSSNVISAPAEDPYNFWNCYVQAGSLPSGPVGFYHHNLLADKDWRQELAAKYNCANLFAPDNQATTEIGNWFEKRLSMIDEGRGVIGRRTHEVLSKNLGSSEPQEKIYLDSGPGVEKLNLEAGELRADKTVEMKGMEDSEGDVWAMEDFW